MAAQAEPKPSFDRTPPQSIEAERSVLGAMLLNPEVVGTGIEILGDIAGDLFAVKAHEYVYNAILALFRGNQPIDHTMLVEQLNRENKLESVGGLSYLNELTGVVPTSANIEYYAKLVLEAALLRRLIRACSTIADQAFSPDRDVEKLLDSAEREIFAIAEQKQTNPIHRVGDLLEEGIHRIEEQMKAKTGVTGVPTGFTKLDEMLSGLQPSDMVILAARPSVGKTALALNIAAHAANHAAKGVLLFSLEMAKEQLVQRLLCMVGRVDSSRLRSGYLAHNEFPKLQSAAATLSNAKIYIDETPNISVLELRSKARRHAAQYPVNLIIIDYLQLMTGSSGGRTESRQVEIAEISRSIKGIARELQAPVLALSQLSREAEKDESGVPKLSHLRESGAIEQDADVVMMLSRLPAKESEGRENVIRVNIAKQRNGPTGVVELVFEKNIQRFGNLADMGGGGGVPEASPPEYAGNYDYGDAYEEDDTPF